MSLIFMIAGIIAGLSLAIVLLTRLGWFVARRRPARFWSRVLVFHAVALPLYLFVATPAVLAWLANSRIGTRGDERSYAGPRIAADGAWVRQSRASLREESTRGATPDPSLADCARACTVEIPTADDLKLRAFLVAPANGPPRCTVALFHGLFRGGLELEGPASIFRDLGAETLLVEMRNHGKSGRSPPTFGLREALDVEAAVAWLRRDPSRAERPLVLFAVSLGTAAVMRAAPDVDGLAGLVLDAPMDDLLATAHRMLGESPRPGHRGLNIWQPFRSFTITALEIFNGFSFRDVRPLEDVSRLRPDLPVLVVGGADDVRMPPASVRAVFDRVPSPPGLKTLWIREGSDHGQVWVDDPAGYRDRLEAFLGLVFRRG
jgi:pimeloyl-ACP methyl ester carboxylesterase